MLSGARETTDVMPAAQRPPSARRRERPRGIWVVAAAAVAAVAVLSAAGRGAAGLDDDPYSEDAQYKRFKERERLKNIVDEMYCGADNCYDVLGVDRSATKKEIKQAYRQLSMSHHPDRGGNTTEFMRVAAAYETLRDDESRSNYDYMLDNPDLMMEHRLRYYKHKAFPKIGVLPIVLVVLTVISVFQYVNWSIHHNAAVGRAMNDPRIRNKAKAVLEERRMLKKKSKKEIEELIRGVVMENIDLRGKLGPPDWRQTAWVQLILLPYTTFVALRWLASWHWRINVNGEEYSDEDKEYLMRRNLGLTAEHWECLNEKDHDEFWDNELWDKKKFDVWQARKIGEQEEKDRQSGRAKRYKRWMKNRQAEGMSELDDIDAPEW